MHFVQIEALHLFIYGSIWINTQNMQLVLEKADNLLNKKLCSAVLY